MIRVALLLGVLAQPAQAALVHFCWAGANGYTMTGSMEFPDALLEADVVTEADVTRFRIAGFLDGQAIGTWDMATREPDDTWYLRYFPRQMLFPTNGEAGGVIDQGWNADGTATDCGETGWGFNAASYAQDFCLDGVWIEESGVEPAKPFVAQLTAPTDPACAGPALLSKRRR